MKSVVILSSWTVRQSIGLIYRFDIIPIKIPVGNFIERHKLILKFIWKNKGKRIVETLLKKKNKVRRIMLTLTHHKAILIKTGKYWQSNRHTDQWNRRTDQWNRISIKK